jgi:hypothetical protein
MMFVVPRTYSKIISSFVKSKSELYYDQQSIGQSVLVPGTYPGPVTNFSLSLFDNFFLQFWVCLCGRPLWREVGSVWLSFCRASPAQPFSDLSPTVLMSIVYCLYFWDPQPGLHADAYIYMPLHSPDLTSLNFDIWRYVKQIMFGIRIQNIQHLKQPIREAATCHCWCSLSSVAGNRMALRCLQSHLWSANRTSINKLGTGDLSCSVI